MSMELMTAGNRAVSNEVAPAQLGARVRARLHRRVIDREIAVGVVVGADPARALRAQQLTSPAERRCVAASLRNILEAAEERHADPASHVRLNHADVLRARHGIVTLIEILRGDQTVAARGVALARLLTVERASPMLWSSTQRSVQDAVCEALAAL
jgi:hypothetical protein